MASEQGTPRMGTHRIDLRQAVLQYTGQHPPANGTSYPLGEVRGMMTDFAGHMIVEALTEDCGEFFAGDTTAKLPTSVSTGTREAVAALIAEWTCIHCHRHLWEGHDDEGGCIGKATRFQKPSLRTIRKRIDSIN